MNYLVKSLGQGIFEVINEDNKEKYLVDILSPKCSCPAFKYTKYKKNTRHKVRLCKHLKFIKGIRNKKI